MDNIKYSNSSEDIPLIRAYFGDMDFIVPFLRKGGPVGFSDSYGNTLLHTAAEGWQSQMVALLIHSGANINAQNKNGDIPLHTLTRSRINPRAPYEEMISKYARSETFLEYSKNRANTNIKNLQGATALHLAADEGYFEAVIYLTGGSSCFIDEVTTKGATALTLAVLGNHEDCASYLIHKGANINFKLPNGMSILDLIRSSENHSIRSLCNKWS